jgi:hypothetical protein
MTNGAPAEPMTADVFVDGEATDVDPGPLLDVFATAGIAVQVRTVPPRRDSATLGWVVLAALPLQAFLTAIGTKTAEDSYAKVRAAVRRLAGRREAGGHAVARPPLVLQDADTGLQVILEPDLPAEAYQQLTRLDITEFHLGPLHYDQRQRRWRSERDEASGR